MRFGYITQFDEHGNEKLKVELTKKTFFIGPCILSNIRVPGVRDDAYYCRIVPFRKGGGVSEES